jgi:predicted NBD/HSP70 family sugar kinase
MNQRLLLDRLITSGPATRPQLAREAGLSLPTVIAAIEDLEEAGLVRLAGRPETLQGRPAQLYEANAAAGATVGVDIGHDWLRVLVADLTGRQLSRLDVRISKRRTKALVERVSQTVADATADADLGQGTIAHTVIGSPGVFDPQQRRVLYAANLPGWQRVGLAEALTESLGTSVTIDNDANLAALGEHAYGAAQGVRQFAYLMIGTGVGLGIIIDGQIYRGATGSAGEVGFLPIGGELSAGQDSHPRRGVLEEALAADAVVRYATQAGMPGTFTAEDVFAAARAGQAPALRAVSIEATHLAQLIASTCAFLDPELIVLGGGIGQNLDLLEPDMRTALARITPLQPKLAQGALGRDAVVLGAIARGVELAREITFTARIEAIRAAPAANSEPNPAQAR